jgi:hypothetical protein
MGCDKSYDLIAHAFGAGEPEVAEHAAECPDCRARLEELKALRDRVGSLPEVAPSGDFVARTRQAWVAAHPEFKPAAAPGRLERLRRLPTWAWSLALHAAAFLIIFTLVFIYRPAPPAVVPAAAPPEVPATVPPVRPPDLAGRAEELNQRWDEALADDPFRKFMQARASDQQRRGHRQMHGGVLSAGAVAGGLEWLARRQQQSGAFDDEEQRVGAVALAALAFLAEGNTPGKGPYAAALSRAVRFLIDRQDARGRFSTSPREHAMATAALVEATLLSGDTSSRHAAETALAALLAARGPEGKWEDPITTAWAAQALRLSILADTRVGVPILAGLAHEAPTGPAEAWTRMISTPTPQQATAGPWAAGAPPGRLSTTLFGTLALYQVGDLDWKEWNLKLVEPLVGAQKEDGSWPGGLDGDAPGAGPAYVTALCTLTLQTYYRYPRFARP